jgi:DNA-binding NarL/FixJ family response regulator
MNILDTICASALPIEELTRRQRQVLSLMLQGCDNEEIATALNLSEKTVKSYVTAVLKCFEVESRYKLIYLCLSYIIEGLQHQLTLAKTPAQPVSHESTPI